MTFPGKGRIWRHQENFFLTYKEGPCAVHRTKFIIESLALVQPDSNINCVLGGFEIFAMKNASHVGLKPTTFVSIFAFMRVTDLRHTGWSLD